MAAVAFLLLRGSLTGSVDQTLRARAAGLTHVAAAGDPDASTETREEVNRAGGLAQIVNGSGRVLAPQVPSFPVPSDAAPVARGQGSSALSTVGTGNAQVRVLTISLGNGTALEVGISLDEFRRSLRVLALDLALVALAGIILAGVVGWLVARTALVPLDRLTGAIDAVAATTDLSHRIEVDDRWQQPRHTGKAVRFRSFQRAALGIARASRPGRSRWPPAISRCC